MVSDPTAARENIQVELTCSSIRYAPSKQPPQKKPLKRFSPSLDRKGMTSRRYRIRSRRTGLSQYMSLSEGRQIDRRARRFTITRAQITVKFKVGSIVKIFQIRYALTFQPVCCRKVISFVQTAASSSLRCLFSWRSRTCFAGSEPKSSQTRQITVIHTINRKT